MQKRIPAARPRHRGARQRRGSGDVRAVARANHRAPQAGWAGRPGRLAHLQPVHGPPFYDSLLAKLIVHAENRPAALARLRRALDEFVVEGIKTNIDFFKQLTRNADTWPARWIPTSWRGCRLPAAPVLIKKDKHLAAAQKFLERGQEERALEEFARVVQEDRERHPHLAEDGGGSRPARRAGAGPRHLPGTAEIYVEQGFRARR